MTVRKVEVIDDAHIEIPVSYGYSLHFEREQPARNRIIKQYAEEILEKVNSLRGIEARIVYQRRWVCSSCDLGFEIDPETGLTACCGEPVEAVL